MQIDQRNNPKLMWIIATGLVVVLLLIIAFVWLNDSSNKQLGSDQLNINAPVAKKVETSAPPLAQPIDQNASSEPTNVQLVNESVLKEQAPQNASLAKEEVAKLEDIQKQLDDQQKSLEAQHTDADQLITLKEEQIKLLEQQLAQHKS